MFVVRDASTGSFDFFSVEPKAVTGAFRGAAAAPALAVVGSVMLSPAREALSTALPLFSILTLACPCKCFWCIDLSNECTTVVFFSSSLLELKATVLAMLSLCCYFAWVRLIG